MSRLSESSAKQIQEGFDALRDLDSNEDGVFDANDAQFAHVRVWRDLNQDGISQEGELFTLDELNIAGINLAATVKTVNLGSGNQQTAEGTYIRSDGSTGKVANLYFVDNPFYREFGDSVTLTEQAKALPGMQGSGAVRDLREAVSLSGAVASALENYAAQTTRAGQLGQLDGLLHAWADSSSMQTSIEQAQDNGFLLVYLVPGQSASDYDRLLGYWSSGEGGLDYMSEADRQKLDALKAQQEAVTREATHEDFIEAAA